MYLLVTGGFMVLDIFTGLIKAFKEKSYNSTTMREGLFHKCGSVCVILLGLLVDYAQQYVDIGVTVPMTLALCSYICLMEIGSITENISGINEQFIPDKIKQYFSKLSE